MLRSMNLFLILLNFSFASMTHMPDIEAPSWRYQIPSPWALQSQEPGLAEPWEVMLTVGPRNLEWLKLLNSRLPADQRIDLYPPGTAKGIPIDDPLKYNAEILNTRLSTLQTEIPSVLKNIIFGQGALPEVLPVDLDTYKTWAKKTDSLYSLGLRWRMMQPYIYYYRQNKVNDFRGLYNLKKMVDTGTQVPVAQLKTWVRDVCANSTQSLPPCDRELARVANRTQLLQIYAKYKPSAEAAYNAFFDVQVPRRDVSLNGMFLAMPFQTHADPVINQFVERNIEDEFKWVTGFLNITITPTGTANVVFLPAVTPHVDSLGGNNIVMNSEIALESWDAQYTIRHEFGHVLGFPDCYMEFYDDGEAAFVNYQFDTKNLMCSRAGRFNATNEAALKKAYGL